jgi:hypothetical protein
LTCPRPLASGEPTDPATGATAAEHSGHDDRVENAAVRRDALDFIDERGYLADPFLVQIADALGSIAYQLDGIRRFVVSRQDEAR